MADDPSLNSASEGQPSRRTPVQKGSCRICYEEEDIDGLIVPCECKGSALYIHRACLDQWREVNQGNEKFRKCDVCKFDFLFEAPPRTPDSAIKEKRVTILNALDITIFVIVFIAIFVCIIVIVAALDKKHELRIGGGISFYAFVALLVMGFFIWVISYFVHRENSLVDLTHNGFMAVRWIPIAPIVALPALASIVGLLHSTRAVITHGSRWIRHRRTQVHGGAITDVLRIRDLKQER